MGLLQHKGKQVAEARHRDPEASESHVADGLLDAEMEALIWARRGRRLTKPQSRP